MTIELDHLFICSQINAPELEHLLHIGLLEGSSNIHPGQGTANRRIFWDNFMLELLFVVDANEVSSPIIAPTHLRERCDYRHTGYSPFGIAFRRQEQDTVLPFPTWAYKPPYLPEHLQIDIAKDTQPHEPLLFVVPFNKKNNSQPTNHPAGIQQITGVQITIPSTKPVSKAVDLVNRHNLVQFISGTDKLVIIEGDRFVRQQEQDFRPHLPLILRW